MSEQTSDAAEPTVAKPANPRGLFCPNCRGVRLVTTHTRQVCPGKTVRHRVCSACRTKVITEEVVARVRKPKSPKGKLPKRKPWPKGAGGATPGKAC